MNWNRSSKRLGDCRKLLFSWSPVGETWPLFVAAAQIRKNYVSFHLMPIYAIRELQKSVSPGLRKRMQGKACFNFTTIDAAHLKELAASRRRGSGSSRKSLSRGANGRRVPNKGACHA
jgi:hypothetical protein